MFLASIIFLLISSATAKIGGPTFKWVSTSKSDQGIPLLNIKFPDNDEDDFAVLNKIQRLPQNICSLEGHLMLDKNVSVKITKNCDTENNYQIELNSQRLVFSSFNIINGTSSPLLPKQDSTSEIQNEEPATFSIQELNLKLLAFYDVSFKSQFVKASAAVIEAITEEAQKLFSLPSLTVKIELDLLDVKEINETITSENHDLSKFLALSASDRGSAANAFVFFTGENVDRDLKVKRTGRVCSTNSKEKLAIVSWRSNTLETSKELAKELGYLLGMDNDFQWTPHNQTKVSERFDRNRQSCTNINGIMDYSSEGTVWSNCSVEDFLNYYNTVKSEETGGQFCLNDFSEQYTNNDDSQEQLRYEGNLQNNQPSGNGMVLYKDGSKYVGQWSNGLRHGQGIIDFSKTDDSKRSTYVGSWENDKRNGFGIMTWINGGKYEGYWLNGLRQGKGKIVFSNESDDLSYEGDWIKDKMSGKGVYIWKDGDVYEGEWLNDMKHGKGKIVFSYENDAQSYEGDWVENQKSGEGIMIWKFGDMYKGDWAEDNMSGKGAFCWWDDGTKYEGEFLNGMKHGKGKTVFPPEDEFLSYVGDFVENQMSGKGLLIWKNGDRYEGGWVENNMSGKGVYIGNDGSKYEGEWLNDMKHGKGKIVFSQESESLSYEGDWVESKMSGKGVYIWKNGSKYEGGFLNDNFHGQGIQTPSTGEILQQGKWVNDEFVD